VEEVTPSSHAHTHRLGSLYKLVENPVSEIRAIQNVNTVGIVIRMCELTHIVLSDNIIDVCIVECYD
jgi:hypothetical protein